MYTVDIDIGGTFTDGFITDGQHIRTVKVLTTPHDITECFMNCITEGSKAFHVELREFLRTTTIVRLSTTIGTNLLVQYNGPKIGLLVSSGNEQDIYGTEKSDYLKGYITSEMIVGIEEKVDESGTVIRKANKEQVLDGIRQLVELGARMVVVSFKNSWRNPYNERLVRDYVRERYPVHYLRSVPLQLGTDVSHIPNDNMRTNSVLLNAYIHSDMARALYRAEDRLREAGYQFPLLVVHASGGNARVAKTVALHTLSSGPAVATRGAAKLAKILGLARVITADMGGTSLDMSVIADGRYEFNHEPEIEGIKLSTPMINVESIGAGGGSIAKVVNKELRVGPESAGSAPGPACYNKGGMEPTVTDANVLLGYIDPDYFLGGRMKLDVEKARRSVERRIGSKLSLSAEDAAYDIREFSNEEMAFQLSTRLRHKGYDPNEFTMYSFGGAGPLHACSIAKKTGIKCVVAFPYGSVFSAFGGSTTDVLHRYSKTFGIRFENVSAAETVLEEFRKQAITDMIGEGFSVEEVQLKLELIVDIDRGKKIIESSGSLTSIKELIQQNFTPLEIKNLLLESVILVAECQVPHWEPTATETTSSDVSTAKTGVRTVYWSRGTGMDTPIYDRMKLEHGHVINGPAIVEGPDTNYPVDIGWTLTVDRYGNLIMNDND